jgi:hypothetical protein
VLTAWLLSATALTGAAEPLLDHFTRTSEIMLGGDRAAAVYMVLLDTTGDGRDEIFLSHEQKCGTGGCPWNIYSPTGPGVVTYLGEAGFAAGGFRYIPRSRSLVVCWHMSAEECSLGRYSFSGGQMRQHPGRSCPAREVWCEKELQRIRAWQAKHAPPFLSSRLPGTGGRLRWTARAASSAGRVPAVEALVVVGTMR